MTLHIETEQLANSVTLGVTGDVTIQTSPDLRQALQPFFKGGEVSSIEVNLAGVDFMDSSGIATLVEGLQWSKKAEGKFVLSGLTETVRDVFELAKLDTVFEIEA